jgi:hypothetical protein
MASNSDDKKASTQRRSTRGKSTALFKKVRKALSSVTTSVSTHTAIQQLPVAKNPPASIVSTGTTRKRGMSPAEELSDVAMQEDLERSALKARKLLDSEVLGLERRVSTLENRLEEQRRVHTAAMAKIKKLESPFEDDRNLNWEC